MLHPISFICLAWQANSRNELLLKINHRIVHRIMDFFVHIKQEKIHLPLSNYDYQIHPLTELQAQQISLQIKNELFLEDINNLLSSGDVPNIYQPDELDRIFQAMRANVQESELQINRSNLLAAFQKVIRNNLHSVITMWYAICILMRRNVTIR